MRDKMTGISSLEEAATVPTHTPCLARRGVPGWHCRPYGQSLKQGRGVFKGTPAATWRRTVSTGVSGCLGRRGQSPAGLWGTDISTLSCDHPPPPHPPPLYPPTPPTLSMFSAQDSRGLLTGYEPWPWETAWGGSSSRRFRTNQLLIYEVNMKLDKYCDSLSTFSLQDVSSPPNWFI